MKAINDMVKSRKIATHRRQQTNNRIIREALAEMGLFNWQLADLLNCSVDTIQRKLRHEMPTDEQERIAQLIREAARHD